MVPFDSRSPSGIFPDFNNPYVLMKPCTQFKSPMASLYAFIQPQRCGRALFDRFMVKQIVLVNECCMGYVKAI